MREQWRTPIGGPENHEKNLLVFAIVIVSLILISTPNASATENIHFGALNGGNFYTITIEPKTAFDASATSRANIGGLVELGLSRNVSLEARAMVVQKGADAKGRGLEQDFLAEATANYVTFPVLLKVKHISDLWRPYLVVGPEVGYKTSASAVVRGPFGVEEDPDFDEGVRWYLPGTAWPTSARHAGNLQLNPQNLQLMAKTRTSWRSGE